MWEIALEKGKGRNIVNLIVFKPVLINPVHQEHIGTGGLIDVAAAKLQRHCVETILWLRYSN